MFLVSILTIVGILLLILYANLAYEGGFEGMVGRDQRSAQEYIDKIKKTH